MNKIIIGIVALVIIGVGAWYFISHKGNGEQIGGAVTSSAPETKYTDPKQGEVAVVGAWDCLVRTDGSETTKDNCLFSLKGDDGKVYALDLSKVEVIGKGSDKAAKIRAVGTLGKSSESDLSGIFNYDAVLAVRVIQSAE
ncbi:hypothetical protein KW800_01690 [Candidatus Parcubacteria bacterium]|nr:hypothetical protein [Candidatus Parcubacteria bacterium]